MNLEYSRQRKGVLLIGVFDLDFRSLVLEQ